MSLNAIIFSVSDHWNSKQNSQVVAMAMGGLWNLYTEKTITYSQWWTQYSNI